MVLLVLKCHMALWRKWHKLHYMKGELLYQLFIIMDINLQGGGLTAVPFRNLMVRIDSAYSNRLTLSREQSC
mgnify:CR=1 FL=1